MSNMGSENKVLVFERKNKKGNKEKEINISVSAIRDQILGKMNQIFYFWLGLTKTDNQKIDTLLIGFYFSWWEYIADNIDRYSEKVTLKDVENEEKFRDWVPYSLSERQRKKAIIKLLWEMIKSYANKKKKNYFGEITFNDLKRCINRFWLTEKDFLYAISYLKKQYKKTLSEDMLGYIKRLENFSVNIFN